MSENKKLRLVEKIESAKPSNMDEEKKAKVLRNIKRTAVVTGTALFAVAIVNAVKYYSSFDEIESTDEEMTTEEN